MSTAEVRDKKPWWKRPTTVGCFGCMFPFAAYLVFVMAIFLPAKMKQDGENTANAEIVIATLQKYHALNGRYPESLDVLQRSGVGPVPTIGYAMSDSGAHFTVFFLEAPIMPMDDDRMFQEWSSKQGGWNAVPQEYN